MKQKDITIREIYLQSRDIYDGDIYTKDINTEKYIYKAMYTRLEMIAGKIYVRE